MGRRKKITKSLNCIVYSDEELRIMRKYLKDIYKISNAGDVPKYEIMKLAEMFDLGGETVENYLSR